MFIFSYFKIFPRIGEKFVADGILADLAALLKRLLRYFVTSEIVTNGACIFAKMHSRLSDAAAKHSHAVKMNIRHIPAMTVLDLRRSMSELHLCAFGLMLLYVSTVACLEA